MLEEQTEGQNDSEKIEGDPAGTGPESERHVRYDVFLSYNTRDRKVVKKIDRALENHGLRAWADWKIPAGSPWLQEIENVIPQVGAALLLIGPSGFGEWHERERQAFHMQGTYIIPVLLPGTPTNIDLPPFLNRHSWIDFRSRITRAEMERLIQSIQEGIAKRPVGREGKPVAIPEPAGWRPVWLRLMAAVIIGMLVWAAVTGGTRWIALHSKTTARISETRQTAAISSRWRPKVPLPRPSVAVMTFENRSGNEDLSWLATAFSDALSAKFGVDGTVRATSREEVALLETDLLLPRKSVLSEKDLSRVHLALGVDHVVTGTYATVGGTSAIRLDLTLYDARDGRRLAENGEIGEIRAWLDLVDRASEGASERKSFRSKLGVPPLMLEKKRQFRALFPKGMGAAILYAQGIDRYRRLDVKGASDLLTRAVEVEEHPLALAVLAHANHYLGRRKEATTAIERAKQLENVLSEKHRREIEIVEREIALDREGFAQSSEALFREFFSDDLGYGLRAVEALLDAGSAEEALLLLSDVRKIQPVKGHPWLAYAEASALFIQQRYGHAQEVAERVVAEAHIIGAVRHEALARLLLSTLFNLSGKGSEAEEQLRLARNGFEQTGDLWGVAQCIEQTASLFTNIDLKTAEVLYQEAITRYEALGDRREKTRALFGLSVALALQGNNVQAQEVSRAAAALAKESPFSLEEGMAALTEGYQFHLMGKLASAQSRYDVARVLFDQINQRDYRAITLSNLGEIEYIRGNFYHAEDLHREALKIHQADNAVDEAAYDAICLGRVKAAVGNYLAARQLYDLALRSLNPAEESAPREPETIAEAFIGLAELDILTGKPLKAEERARKAEEVANGAGQNTLRARARSLSARALLEQGRGNEAQQAAKEALALAAGDFRAIHEAGITAARTRAAAGDVTSALATLQKINSGAARAGLVVYELEGLLTAGEIELADGRINSGRRRLEAIRTRAAKLGFGQIEKRTAAALGM